MSYPGHSLIEFYPSAVMQSMYSTADWAMRVCFFSLQLVPVTFHWSLSDGKFPKAFWTLSSIQFGLSSSMNLDSSHDLQLCLFCKDLCAPSTKRKDITFIFNSLFSSLARLKYLSIFFLFLSFVFLPKFFFCLFWLINTKRAWFFSLLKVLPSFSTVFSALWQD